MLELKWRLHRPRDHSRGWEKTEEPPMKKAAKKRPEGQVESFGQRMLPIAAVMFTLRRGLRDFVVEAGVQALDALLEDERTQLCGPRYRHDADRRAKRAGHASGELVMGGRGVRISRPRARSADG